MRSKTRDAAIAVAWTALVFAVGLFYGSVMVKTGRQSVEERLRAVEDYLRYHDRSEQDRSPEERGEFVVR